MLVARVFSLQRQVIYQIKAKRLNYLIKDFISSNFKRRLSFLLLNSEVLYNIKKYNNNNNNNNNNDDDDDNDNPVRNVQLF